MNISKDYAISPEYEDTSWQPVVLPHTYNSEDGAGRMTAADGGDYYRGTVCYRRNLALSFEECSGKELYLEFEGANTVRKSISTAGLQESTAEGIRLSDLILPTIYTRTKTI